MSSIKTILLAVAASFACLACFHAEDNAIDSKCSALATTFFRLPLKKQIAELSSRELEEQYVILICGNQVIHPPALYLVEPFAREGRRAADFLTGKLSKASGDLTIRDIVMVLSEMNRVHAYDVAADIDLMNLIETRVGTIKDDGVRRLVEQRVKDVKASQ